MIPIPTFVMPDSTSFSKSTSQPTTTTTTTTSSSSSLSSSSTSGGDLPAPPSPPTGGDGKPSTTARFKALLKEYGKVAVGTHISLALLSLGGFYAAVRLGVDVGSALRAVGLDLGRGGEEAGSFAVAYTAHKMLTVPRMGITLAVTPPLAKRLREAGILAPSSAQKHEPSKSDKEEGQD
eukprot:CAMPEP_0174231872 /NCGR_PEP_ID=MMETSP0417-20130205/2289_1 /TAXON_ID=242541 /ORGANISM="Mayorella sp, Strain BSH-02190019" /LENGTH=178 /DNA_ID=CAMNT_0015309831 /DNA_START=360 /DNA_END=893 /DNA_ORIENTATION=-